MESLWGLGMRVLKWVQRRGDPKEKGEHFHLGWGASQFFLRLWVESSRKSHPCGAKGLVFEEEDWGEE